MMVLADRVAAHYNELDRFYRDIWGEHLHHGLWLAGDETPQEAAEQLIHLVMARGGMVPRSKILDVGSGYGGTARFLADELNADVTAVTLSERQHAYASSHAKPPHGNVTYHLNDFYQMEPAAPFDYILAVESLSHMEEPAQFLKRAHDFLKPGGRIIVCAWLCAERPQQWERTYLLESICRDGHLSGLAPTSEVASWLTDAGFTPISFDDLSNHVRHTWTVCIRRLAARLVTDPSYLAFLTDGHRTNRFFAFTLVKIWLAYRTGAMRYGVFVSEKE